MDVDELSSSSVTLAGVSGVSAIQAFYILFQGRDREKNCVNMRGQLADLVSISRNSSWNFRASSDDEASNSSYHNSWRESVYMRRLQFACFGGAWQHRAWYERVYIGRGRLQTLARDLG